MKNKLVLVVVLVLAVGVLVVMGSSKNKQKPVPEGFGTVSVTPEVEREQLTEVRSGDGSVRVVKVTKDLRDGNVSYQIKTNNAANGNEKVILTKEEIPGWSIDLPANSWSPNNKQFFIVEKSPNGADHLVFKIDGQPFSDGSAFLNLDDYWRKTKHTLTIGEVSGWGGDDLLVVATSMVDGSEGPQYWFVTSSRSFMQLAH